MLLAGFTIDLKETFFRGGLRRDISEGGIDHTRSLCIPNEFKESCYQFILGLALDVSPILVELELRLSVLDLHDQLDGIQIGAFTGIRFERPVKRLAHLLAKIVAGIFRQPDGDPLLALLLPTGTAKAALVDQLERPDLRVLVVPVVRIRPWARSQPM